MDDVYSAIGLVDLYTFVCENFDDLQRFLDATKARGDRVGAGLVPSVQQTVCSDDAAKVVERFEAPEGLKRYLSTLLSFCIVSFLYGSHTFFHRYRVGHNQHRHG